MSNIVIVATMIAKEGKADFVKAELNKLVEPTLAEVGNFGYQMHQDILNPNKFVAIEEWRDGEAIQAHMATCHIKAYGQATTKNDAIESFEYVSLKKI